MDRTVSPWHAALSRLTRAMKRPAPAAGFAVAVGVALGVLTLWGQGHLPDGLSPIANSGAVWLLVAALVGVVMSTDLRGALAGAVTLFVAILAYYGAAPLLVSGASSAPSTVVIWSVAAVVAGAVFGVAGRWIRSDRPGRRSTAAVLIGGSFLAEGIVRLIIAPANDGVVAIAMIAAGLVVPLAIGRSPRERLVGLLGQPVVVGITLVAYWAIDQAFLR